MFAQQQIVATLAAGNGRIAIDEHSSVSCMIHDVTARTSSDGYNLT